MRVLLITGGARSGKSEYARRRAHELGGDDVTVVATARAVDEEMKARIERHRAERPEGWETLEAPTAAGAAIRDATGGIVLLDCLTLSISNALLDAEPKSEREAMSAMSEHVDDLLRAIVNRDGTLVAVTNEVGLGVVPGSALGRWFRDGLGTANRRVAEIADTVVLMVSGIPTVIKEGGLS